MPLNLIVTEIIDEMLSLVLSSGFKRALNKNRLKEM